MFDLVANWYRDADVLLTVPTTFVKSLLQETTATPIVMLSTPDPVRSGLVTNLARLEGNVTAWFGYDIVTKRILEGDRPTSHGGGNHHDLRRGPDQPNDDTAVCASRLRVDQVYGSLCSPGA